MYKYLLYFSFAFLTGCGLDTSIPTQFLPGFTLSPSIVCEGDPVQLGWAPRPLVQERRFCRFPDGGLPERNECVSNGDCRRSTSCVNNLCVADSLLENLSEIEHEIDFTGEGCFQDTIFDAAPGLRRDAGRLRFPRILSSQKPNGRASYVPAETEVISGRAATDIILGFPTKFSLTRSLKAIVLPAVRDDSTPVHTEVITFVPFCRNPSGPWTIDVREGNSSSRLLLSTAQLDPGEDVEITGVRNLSDQTVFLTKSPPEISGGLLAPGEATVMLNGEISRLWTLSVENAQVPASCITDERTELPPIPIELTLECKR